MAIEGYGGRLWGTANVSSTSLLLHLLLFVLLQACHFSYSHAAYTLADFLAAYNNPAVSYHEVKGNIVLSASLPPLERSLTLVGKAPTGSKPVVIDGARKYTGIIIIPNGGNLTLVNLEFSNFYTDGMGAVVSVGGQWIDINRCIFRNNRAGDGGALDFSGMSYRIVKSQFIGNIAKTDGGALYSMSDGYGPIKGCVFEGNHAGGSGGAAYFKTELGAGINGCTFRNNTAGFYGGAIRFSKSSTTIKKSKFEGNVAAETGGAFRFYGEDQGVLTFCKGNTFKNNIAKLATSNNIELEITHEYNTWVCSPLPPATLVIGNRTRSCRTWTC